MVSGTICYSLDKGLYLLDHAARETELQKQLGAYGGLSSVIDIGSITQIMDLFTVLFVVCWWGFLAYLFVNRTYFGNPSGGAEPR